MGEPEVPEVDSGEDVDVVGCRDRIGDDLEGLRHVDDRKDEVRQQERREVGDQDGHLVRHHLGLRHRRDEEAERQRDQDVERGGEDHQIEARLHHDAKENLSHEDGDQDVDQGDQEVGNRLAHEEFPRPDGERPDRFHRAVFVLPGDDKRGQHRPDDHDDDRDDSRDDEVPAFQVLVKPDPDPPLDGRSDLLHPLPVEEIGEELPVVALDEAADVGAGDSGEVRIAPIEQDLDGGLPVRPEVGGPAGGDNHGQRRPAVVERLCDGPGVGEPGRNPEVGGGAEAADEVAAHVRLFLIDDDRLDVFHVEAERIAEQEDEEQRDGECKIKASEVPKQVVDLLAGDRLDISRIHARFLSLLRHQRDKGVVEVRVRLSGTGPADDLVRASRGDDPPLVDHHNPPAVARLVHIVRRDEDGDPLPGDPADEAPEVAPGDRIDAGGRLVEKEDPRAVEEGAAEGEALAPSRRDILGETVARLRQAGHVEDPGDPFRPFLLRHAVHPEVEAEVFEGGQILVEGELLGHVADGVLHLFRLRDDVVARDLCLPRRGGEDPAEHPDRRRFPGAVRPEKAEDLAGTNRKGDSIHGGERPETFFKLPDDDGVRVVVSGSGHMSDPWCAGKW